MQKLIWQNANNEQIDLTSGNYGIVEWQGFSNADLNIQSQQVPFQDGGVFLDALIEARELSITLAMQDNNDLEKRYRMRRELIHALNPKLGEGYLIYTNNFISKRIKCVAQIPLFQTHNSNDSGTPKASLAWTACNPYWEDLEEKNIFIENGLRKEIINEGDVACGVKINLYPIPSAKNPVIKNIAENKKIGLDGTFTKTISINTNTGKKEITETELKWSFDNFAGAKKVVYSAELGLLVAVGNNNLIMTSEDGINWEFQTFTINSETVTSIDINDVVYSDVLHKFIACGGESYYHTEFTSSILTSSDGKNWNCIGIGTEEQSTEGVLKQIVYSANLDLFVAVGNNSNIFTSSDCITWTKREIAETGYNINSIAYSETLGKFIAVTLSSGSILSSTDGINWTYTEINNVGGYIIYSEQKHLFVVAGSRIATSTDGINFAIQSETYNPIIMGISYINKIGAFFAFQFDDDNEIFTIKTSTDGITWQNYISDTRIFSDLIFYEKGGFFINDNLFISNDGLKYSSSKKVTGTKFVGTINKITYSKRLSKYLSVGSTSIVWTSSDGINWLEAKVSDSYIRNLYCAIYVEEWGLFFVAGDVEYIYRSSDGISWNGAELEGFFTPITSMVYSKKQNKLVIVNTSKLYISTDGINWVGENHYNNISYITYSETLNIFVAFKKGNYQEYYISADCITWEEKYFDEQKNITNAIFAEELGLFIVLCQGGVLTSPDGINWEEHTLENVILSDVIYSEELCMLIACGTHNKKGCIAVSYDGKTWNVEDLQTDSGLMSIAENTKNINFCIVGTEAKILNSIKVEGENIINDLSNDSDLSLSFESGENELLLTCEEGNINGVISYRQKYIGV